MSDPAYPALARRFGDALRVGDPELADRVIGDALLAGAPPDAVQSLVIGPAMARIGELWEAGVVSVAEEHLATSICQRALVRLYSSLSAARAGGPRRERVLLAAIEGQRHVLGLQMVADLLDGAGFDVLNLGGDVPIDDLRTFVEDRRPAVVGLAFGIAPHASRLVDAVLAVHDACAGTRLMLGGPGVPIGLREAGYPWVADSTAVVRTVERLVAGPPQVVPEIFRVLASGGTAEPSLEEAAVETDAIAEGFARVADDATNDVRRHVRVRADGGAPSPGDTPERDGLTGLPGRGAFLDRLREAAEVPEPQGAMLMVDVDDLRGLNAVHGRGVGDAVLRTVADVLRDVLRPEDVLARTGGDEFMAVLAGATPDTARRVADRLRAAVAAGTTPRVTVGVGTAGLTSDPRAVLLAAWTDLYTAKAARPGRQGPGHADVTPGEVPHPAGSGNSRG